MMQNPIGRLGPLGPFRPALAAGALGTLLALAALAPAGAAHAADAAGTVKTVRGTATIERGAQRIPATPGVKVEAADRIRTGADSSVGILLADNTTLTAGPNAQLSLDRYRFDSTTHQGEMQASVQRGSLAVISGKLPKASPESVRFQTPSVTLGVRGTSFVIDAGTGE